MNHIKLFSLTLLGIFILKQTLSQEICNNSLDDDGDGLIDLNGTTDCYCKSISVASSIIPNFNFNQMDSCPSTGYQQLSHAKNWVQATLGTTDYWNCSTHMPAANTLGLDSPVGVEGYTGIVISDGWQEYLGTCLSSTMNAGENYSLQFNIALIRQSAGALVVDSLSPIEITLFGSDSCRPFPISTLNCPAFSPDWAPIGTILYNPSSSWTTVQMDFTPTFDVQSIILGSPCNLPIDYAFDMATSSMPYAYLDDLILLDQLSMNGGPIDTTGKWCDENLELQIPVHSIINSIQWYYEGVALSGQTNYALSISANNYHPGTYSCIIYDTLGNCGRLDYELAPPQYPVAHFGFQSVCEGMPMQFTDSSQGTVAEYHWNFGDGNTDTSANPTHIFADSGQYTVQLHLVSDKGCSHDTSQLVSVWAKPVADFMANSTCQDTTTFTNLSTSGSSPIFLHRWDFSSIDTSHQKDPSFLFPTGSHDVTLWVESSKGCRDTITKAVEVFTRPQARFLSSSQQGCSPFCPQFQDMSLPGDAPIVSQIWSIQGQTFLGSNISHCFENTGSTSELYDVKCIVIDSNLCADTAIKTNWVEVLPVPTSLFKAQIDSTDINQSRLKCFNNSEGASTFLWEVTGGFFSTESSPDFLLPDTGKYQVQLISENSYGCLDTTYNSVRVNPTTAFHVPSTFTPNGDGINEEFFFEGMFVQEEEFIFEIYNRWGVKIYSTESFQPWDGKQFGEPLKQDVYLYSFQYKDYSGRKHRVKGEVILLPDN